MMYQIIISQKAFKQIENLDKENQKRIFSAFERIRIRPESHVKRLVGEKLYKLRVGNYRIILDIDKGKLIILILKVGHRRNIYK